jgi:ABC-2 type transport system permease protein
MPFGILGVSFGFWAKNFEALSFVTTFIMQPMIFLAGIFYPIATLRNLWNMVSQFNPIRHNVNLIRYAITGYADGSAAISLWVVVGLTAALFGIMSFVMRRNLRMS